MASQSAKVVQFFLQVIVPEDTPVEVFHIQLEDALTRLLGPTVYLSRALLEAPTEEEKKEMH